MNDYTEARQHLNLSQIAYDTLIIDRYEFLEKPSLAGILNKVISTYMDEADASIDNALGRYKARLEEQLSAIPDNGTKRAVIDKLLENYQKELAAKANGFPRGQAVRFRLDKENYDAIQEWRDENDYYAGSPGKFLKAVLEEYARKPLLEREGIILRDTIDRIRAAIHDNQLLIITLRGQQGIRHEVRPYSIEHDPGYNYHYLVGYSRKAGTDDAEKPASFRLSRISGLKPSRARSGKVTAEQRREIEKKLQTVGVQFLLQEPDVIRLKLTPRGKQMYESQAHLRPVFTSREECEDGSWIYEFNCTQIQAEYYFFKFGAEAKVDYPINLQKRLMTNYDKALKRYMNKENVFMEDAN